MAKQGKLYSATQAAHAIKLTLSSFRTKVSKLGIKGTKQGRKVFYTRKQLENIQDGIFAKGRKTVSSKTTGKTSKSNRSKLAVYKTRDADYLLSHHLKSVDGP